MSKLLLLLAVCSSGCYAGAMATADNNAAWQGRSSAQLERQWGPPAAVARQGDGTVRTWSHTGHHFTLPSASVSTSSGPGMIQAAGTFRPGETWTTRTLVTATVDAVGTIRQMQGLSRRWGVPNDANLRWGAILGFHVGMGRLDDTANPLPSGGLYIGGMLSPTVGLVGTFSLAAGSDDDGGAMAFAWGLAPMWWATTRLSFRAGPAMVLAFDPGFDNPTLQPGLTGGASFALIRTGNFVLDLRADITQGTSVTFGSLGIGVNLN